MQGGVYYQRLLKNTVQQRLQEYPVVQIIGPRQAGKTTLVKVIAEEANYQYVDMLWQEAREFIEDNTQFFLTNNNKVIFDEAQVYPQLTGSLLSVVDRRGSNGQYVLTGSFSLTRSPRSTENLAGRMCTLELLPLSQVEIRGSSSSFLEEVFSEDIRFDSLYSFTEQQIIEMMLQGGYPKLMQYTDKRKRNAWLRDYIVSIQQLDIKSFRRTRVAHEPTETLRKLAGFSTQNLDIGRIANDMAIDRRTVMNLVSTYEDLRLIRMLPRFHKQVASKKSQAQMQFVDSGLFSVLLDWGADNVQKDRTRLGILLETFVHGELAKLCNASEIDYRLYHWRGKNEVDFVIVNPDGGSVVGIEVKASSNSLSSKDCKGLLELKRHCGTQMKNGILLYLGNEHISMGSGIHQIPISFLWSDNKSHDIPLLNK